MQSHLQHPWTEDVLDELIQISVDRQQTAEGAIKAREDRVVRERTEQHGRDEMVHHDHDLLALGFLRHGLLGDCRQPQHVLDVLVDPRVVPSDG